MVFAEVSCQEPLGELKSESLGATSTTLNNVCISQGAMTQGEALSLAEALCQSCPCSQNDLSIYPITEHVFRPSSNLVSSALEKSHCPVVPAGFRFGDGPIFHLLLQMIFYTYSTSSCLCEIYYQ